MASTLPTLTSHRVGWIAATVTALVVTAVLLTIASTSSGGTRTSPGLTTVPAAEEEPDRGAGDPCALRYETGGGFLEGLDQPNRCGPAQGSVPLTGRLP